MIKRLSALPYMFTTIIFKRLNLKIRLNKQSEIACWASMSSENEMTFTVCWSRVQDGLHANFGTNLFEGLICHKHVNALFGISSLVKVYTFIACHLLSSTCG